jgi:tRNA pseudouridine32 synthase/23S rRNA pseudouridine746 synthase
VGASQVFCPQGGWRTVFEFLCQRFIFVSTEEWACRFESSSIFDAQGQALNLDSPYTALSPVYYFRTVAQEPVLPYEETVLYQDENLVVADKPHFLPVVPSGPYVQETLLVRCFQFKNPKERLIMPCLEMGKLPKLIKQLRRLEPNLTPCPNP